MNLKNKELGIEFYTKFVKEKYPELSYEEYKSIVLSPWQYLKQEMESGELSAVRFKYFGKFQVFPGRAKAMLHNLERRNKLNKVDKKQYIKLKEMLTKFLQNENKS